MKTLLRGVIALLLMIIAFNSAAQVVSDTRQPMFRSMSDRLPASLAELGKAFTAPVGSVVHLRFYKLAFEGKVISSVQKFHNLHSVIIKSPALDNTLLSISRRTNSDKSIIYTGRILNEQYADAYELTRNADGSYVFQKIQTAELIQDY